MKFIILPILLSICTLGFSQSKNIHKQSYEKIEFVLLEEPPNAGLGSSLNIALVFTNKKGQEYYTEGFNDGKIDWSQIDVVSDIVHLKKGELTLSNRISDFPEHYVNIDFQYKKTNEVFLSHRINLNYSGEYVLDLSGEDGDDGTDGRNGTNGGGGSSSSSGNGGSGDDGGEGKTGRDGLNGSDANDYVVSCESKYEEVLKDTLVYVQVSSEEELQDQFIISKSSGSLLIKANGGNGGKGGNGGYGGSGGNGGSGANTVTEEKRIVGKGGDGGSAGSGGDGADGGNGGSGGNITFKVKEYQKELTSIITFEAAPGIGGQAGVRGLAGKLGVAGVGGSGSGRSGTSAQSGSSGYPGSNGSEAGKIEIVWE